MDLQPNNVSKYPPITGAIAGDKPTKGKTVANILAATHFLKCFLKEYCFLK